MGIDAEILIRGVRDEVVTDDWLLGVSWRVCQALGANQFFTSDGLPPDEYDSALGLWNSKFEGHLLHLEMKAAEAARDYRRRQELRDKIVEDVGKRPEQLRPAIERTCSRFRDDYDYNGGPLPAPGKIYFQDGPEILADEGECLLKANIWTRYYGEGYERGDLLFLCSLAEWIELNIDGAEVWYGGDSSGVLATPFPHDRRCELRRHLFSDSGRAYFGLFQNLAGGRGEFGTPPACGLCPGGLYRGNRHGFGSTFASFSCAGCGKTARTDDSGATWKDITGISEE